MECLYESEHIRAVTGRAIRPGGLALTELAQRFCRLPVGARVLDVGCGVGATVEFLRQEHHHAAFGVDMSPFLLRMGITENPRLALLQGTGETLPFPDRCFSALFCECVLSLLPDPVSALKEFSRVLKPSGYLILCDVYTRIPDPPPCFQRLPVHCCIKGAAGRKQILAMVERIGFTVVTWEDHTDLLKQLAAQLIFRFGSLSAFWAAVFSREDPELIQETVKSGRPGYYLLIARREGNAHGRCDDPHTANGPQGL
jgi:SAM-dependent methyltransferase